MGQKPDAVAAFTQAFDKMSELTIHNFDWRTWGIFGVIAFFVNCGRSQTSQAVQQVQQVQQFSNPAFQSAGVELSVLLLVFALVILILGVLMVCFYYIMAKGEFSMMSKIATGNLETPLLFMGEYDEQVMSLFKLRLLLLFLPTILLFGVIGLIILGIVFATPELETIANGVGLVAIIFLALALFFITMFLGFLINNYVTTIMFAKNQMAFESLSEGWKLFTENIGQSLIFMLIRFAITIISGVLMMVAMIVGAVACCITCIPIIGPLVISVLTAPVHVFSISHSMYYMQGHGSLYHMFGSTFSTPNNNPYTPPPSGYQGDVPPYGGGSGGSGITVQPTLEEYEAQQQQQYQQQPQDPYAQQGQYGDQPQYQQDPYAQQPQQEPGDQDQDGYDPYNVQTQNEDEQGGIPEPPPPGYDQNDSSLEKTELYDSPDQGGGVIHEADYHDQQSPPPVPDDYQQGGPPPLPPESNDDDDNGLPPPPPPLPKDNDGNPYPPPPPPPKN